jgi:hypothetical protein
LVCIAPAFDLVLWWLNMQKGQRGSSLLRPSGAFHGPVLRGPGCEASVFRPRCQITF